MLAQLWAQLFGFITDISSAQANTRSAYIARGEKKQNNASEMFWQRGERENWHSNQRFINWPFNANLAPPSGLTGCRARHAFNLLSSHCLEIAIMWVIWIVADVQGDKKRTKKSCKALLSTERGSALWVICKHKVLPCLCKEGNASWVTSIWCKTKITLHCHRVWERGQHSGHRIWCKQCFIILWQGAGSAMAHRSCTVWNKWYTTRPCRQRSRNLPQRHLQAASGVETADGGPF